MLKVTQDAATLLTTSRASAGHPDSFGVRFFVAETEPEGKARLGFEFVERPQPKDQVTDQLGLPVYVAPELADTLGEATLDAQPAASGSTLVLKR